MRSLLALLACLALALTAPTRASAAEAGYAIVVAAGCGTATYTGGNQPITQNTSGQTCSAASVTASISGFTAATTGTPFTATTGGATGTLPAGAVVVVSNAGATNTAYCALGGSATTANQPIPPASWFAFTVGVATQLTCATSTSTTTINMTGGAGLATGSGGGGGGGGSGSNASVGTVAATAPTSATYMGANKGGALVAPLLDTNTLLEMGVYSWGGTLLGAPSNYGTSPGAVEVMGVNASITNTPAITCALCALETGGNLATLAGAVTSSVVQSNTKQVNGVTTLAGAGATGPGAQRMTVAQDTTTLAGSAPGTAGTPSAQVATVQGAASMTPVQTALNTTPSVANGNGVVPAPTTTGGLTLKSFQVLANATSVAVDASAGQLYEVEAFNNSASIAYIKYYNTAQGSTTCGSGTPVYRQMIPAASSGGNGYLKASFYGTPFTTAITACITTGYADSDATAPAATTYIVNWWFK
jgi:hypothetical protein